LNLLNRLGKSWILSVPGAGDQLMSILAGIDALRAELADAGRDKVVVNTRLGLRLSPDEVAELAARLEHVIDEYHARAPTRGGSGVGLHITLHSLAPPRP
jgi:hypothetical protein